MLVDLSKLKELRISKQIEILKLTIEKLINDEEFINYGMCFAIDNILMSNKILDDCANNFMAIEILIPSFNRDYAIKLSSKYDFQAPTSAVYWWARTDNTVRIKFLEALIQELEIQQKIQALEECKELVKKGYCVCDSLCEKYRGIINDSHIFYRQLPKYFPILTHSNAIIACREKHVILPNKYTYDGMFYWERDNIKSRLAFVNWMIQQLKK